MDSAFFGRSEGTVRPLTAHSSVRSLSASGILSAMTHRTLYLNRDQLVLSVCAILDKLNNFVSVLYKRAGMLLLFSMVSHHDGLP